jgi:plasmid stabilization system protein ParE
VKLRYTPSALKQIDDAIDYIGQQSPDGAVHVAKRLNDIINMLSAQPMAGPPTSRGNIRRFVVTPYPYCIYYRLTKTDLVIIGIRHTSRRPKP